MRTGLLLRHNELSLTALMAMVGFADLRSEHRLLLFNMEFLKLAHDKLYQYMTLTLTLIWNLNLILKTEIELERQNEPENLKQSCFHLKQKQVAEQ